MSLYSSDTLSSVGEDNQAEANHGSVSEREILSVYDNESPWFYLSLIVPKWNKWNENCKKSFRPLYIKQLYTVVTKSA